MRYNTSPYLKSPLIFLKFTKKNPSGKLRLLYEANALAFIAEQSGGKATDGNRRIMDIQPNSLHQRTPLLIGSKEMVVEAQSLITNTKEKITEFSQ